ncbi:ATP-dependent endonuclease [Chryseobacterium sp. W4I1]|uniref:ATP-dependent nuclease n=1 Tax=Chryseobacterium sp. W4I1 TaxID=3042293 RepID=UPI002783E097|nr:AAA family ATPase [Chryseobacterium sp. W4I1]MDQ0783201.1 putative ATP-dependent endonuclease of OLD family [Chryseobacterium sp. W4I1]
MILKEIQIKNFRSIKDENIIFNHNCIILLGKNEAGKSNILKAIAAVFGEYIVSNKDKRKRVENEKIEEYSIRAIFSLNDNDFKKILEEFKKKFTGIESIIFKTKISLVEYLQKVFSKVLIKLDIADNKKPIFKRYSYPKNDVALEKELYLNTNNTITPSATGVKFNIENELFTLIQIYYEKNPIKCHYWQYKDNYLLPNSVNIQEFINSPSQNKALENIFSLCGRDDIEEEFNNAYSEDGDYSNLLEQISKKVTSTFQKIWKDFRGTSIQLLTNGDEILIKVVDKAKYNFEDRSDGFKKFISILLMLSTEARTNKIQENDIILMDEPDQSLYPSSAQYLRDELIDISKKAKIIYSTHSQYMIDSNCIDRHLIIEKKDDITFINKDEIKSPFATDELLRRAIGTSIFESLQEKNIIFEGYLDKLIFDSYVEFHKLEKEFEPFGKVYLSGISGVETLTQILILANKKLIIVADSDETSNKKKIEYQKNYPQFKDAWLAYGDIDKNIATLEDFYTPNYLETQISKSGYEVPYDKNKNAIFNIEKAVNKDKELKQKLKVSLAEKIRKTYLTDSYSQYVNALKEKLENL